MKPPSQLADDRGLMQPPGDLLAELRPDEQQEDAEHDVERGTGCAGDELRTRRRGDDGQGQRRPSRRGGGQAVRYRP